MKRILLCMLHVALIAGLASCEKGIDEESAFIGTGTIDPGQSNDQWDWVDVYPGPVNSQIERLQDTTITILGKYKPIPYSPETPILQSTGLYAAADELIFVEVPDAAAAANLKWQIGLAQPLGAGQAQRRYRDVVSRGTLTAGQNQIRGSYGGYIYFYYEPEDAAAAPTQVEVSVRNAVQSFDYFKGSDAVAQRYYVNVMKDRVEKLRDTGIDDNENVFLYWTELRSPKIILTFGVKEMQYLTNPERLLEQYEQMVDVYLKFAGYDPNEEYELPPFRMYADIQLPNSRQQDNKSNNEDVRYAPGYPMGVLKHSSMRGTSYLDEARYMNNNDELNFGFNNGKDIKVDMVHNSLQMTVLGEWAQAIRMKWGLQRLANLYYCYQISNGTYMGSPGYLKPSFNISEVLTRQRFPVTTQNKNSRKGPHGYLSDRCMWLYGNYVTTSNPGTKDGDIQYNLYGDKDKILRIEGWHAISFLQLIQQYGWGLIPYVNQRCQELGFVNEYEQDCFDFFAMAASEYAGRDLRPFFRWWQYPFTAYAAHFMAQFPALDQEYTYMEEGATTTKNYYFFDWPLAAETFFPNDKLQISTDSEIKAVEKKPWPEKPYYTEVDQASTNTTWKIYGETVNAYYKDVGPKKTGQNNGEGYEPEYIPLPSHLANASDKGLKEVTQYRGFLASTYFDNYRSPNIKSNTGSVMNLPPFIDGNWLNAGNLGSLKSNWGDAAATNNYNVIDIDFGKPLKFNAIKFRQCKGDFNNNPMANFIMYLQYYVEPEYWEEADPTDPSSTGRWVKSGSISSVNNPQWNQLDYNYDPEGDPRRVIWTGFEKSYDPNSQNTVPYPGRTKNKTDDPEATSGYWGFHEGGKGYFNHVYVRKPIIDRAIEGAPQTLDQDWYYGFIWLHRDGYNRSYVYYLEETVETRRIRFTMRPTMDGRGNSFGDKDGKSWDIRFYEMALGLVDTEVPAPGTIPMPHSWYVGAESGEYPLASARPPGGAENAY